VFAQQKATFTINTNQVTGDLTTMCDIMQSTGGRLPFISADCPEEVLCPCCTLCFDENDNPFNNF